MVIDSSVTLERWQRRIRACHQCVSAGYLPEARPVFRGHNEQVRMLVGQAPAANDHLDGIPWVGPSGNLLRTWLTRAGFDPEHFFEDWYLTSLTKCFPGKALSGSGDRPPSTRERSLCHPWLDGEIALLQPRLIVTIGRMAADALIPGARRESLATLVGTFHYVDLGYGSIPIVPLPHPSGVGRWLNDPVNRELVEVGLDHIKAIEGGFLHEKGFSLGDSSTAAGPERLEL